MNRRIIITTALLLVWAITPLQAAKPTGNGKSYAEKAQKILHDAMLNYEEKHPDAISTIRYDVKPDGSTISFWYIDQKGELGEDVMKSVNEMKELFDSVETAAKKESPIGTVMSANDGYSRSIRFQDADVDTDISMYDAPEKYRQAFLLSNRMNFVAEMYHYWRTDADKSYTKAADLSDLDRAFYNMFEDQKAVLKKVKYKDDSYFSGALRILSQDDQNVTGTIVIIPRATSKQWIKLSHLLMSHIGDKGRISVSYSRDRSVYIVDYVTKTIYAATLRNNAMYFMKATYSGIPYLPSNWAPEISPFERIR